MEKKNYFFKWNIILGVISVAIGIIAGLISSNFKLALIIVLVSVITTITCSLATKLVKNPREIASKNLPDDFDSIIMVTDGTEQSGPISCLIMGFAIFMRSLAINEICKSYDINNYLMVMAVTFGIIIISIVIVEGFYIGVIYLMSGNMWLIGQEDIAVSAMGASVSKYKITDVTEVEVRKYRRKKRINTNLVLHLSNGKEVVYWGTYATRNIDTAVVYLEERIHSRNNFVNISSQSVALDKDVQPVAAAFNNNIVYTNVNNLNWQKINKADKRELTAKAREYVIIGSIIFVIMSICFIRSIKGDMELYIALALMGLYVLVLIGFIIRYIINCCEKMYSIDVTAFNTYANVQTGYEESSYYVDIQTDDGLYAGGISCKSEDYIKIRDEGAKRVRIVKRGKGNKCYIFLYKYL